MEDRMEVNVTDADFKKEVLESDIPVLVDFWAEWCAPCKMVAPVVAEIAKDYEGKLKVCKVSVDEAQKSASEYGVMSIPTLILFKGGEVADTIVGLVPKAKLAAMIDPHLGS